jgi:hypothetical protein
LKTDPCTQSVDFLKFPACWCDWVCGSFMDHFRHLSTSYDSGHENSTG